MKKHSKTQKGNPHRLTIRQHIFPKSSINRFNDVNKQVSLFRFKDKNCVPVNSLNAIFCVFRAWDQRAETGYMKRIEDQFQSVVNNIIKGNLSVVSDHEKRIINAFFALWHFRSKLKSHGIPNQITHGIANESLTQDQEEILESKHCGFIRSDQTIPSNQVAGDFIQMKIAEMTEQLTHAQWGVLHAKEGEFLVPDNCPDPNIYPYALIPLTPTICLVHPSQGGVISNEVVAEINNYLFDASCEYYFARDISKCPLK